jgi:CTP synthase
MRRTKRDKTTKHVFVTGGVVSSVGKGLTCACIGTLMEHRGLKVTLMKLDPYINVDPGTMNPFQHGEVFVLDDGAETDLDLGHYERFTTCRLSSDHNLTTGKVYNSVISKEREGKYLGATVQVIPHITNEIKDHVLKTTSDVDVAIIEIGGTIGDIESLPFLEAVRQLLIDLGPQNAISVHVTLVPYIAAAGELKTKPTQHSVQKLREIGIQPDILICRSDRPIEPEHKRKIGLYCNVPGEAVINAVDVSCIYELPLALAREQLDDRICEYLNIWSRSTNLKAWNRIAHQVMEPPHEITIAMVGKYVNLKDSYLSLNEALVHGGIANGCRVKIRHVDSEEVEKKGTEELLAGAQGILVPGGFGDRGIEGKVMAIQYARERRLPYFGICLGMQLAVVEFARNVLGLRGANSTEFVDRTPDPVIHLLPGQQDITDKGATMRLGAYPCRLKEGSLAGEVYGKTRINERHRHRYEFNNDYRQSVEAAGMVLSGISPDDKLVEIVELKDHPWFLGCQFHPEFKSRPTDPHPLFSRFVGAALEFALKGVHSEPTPLDSRDDEPSPTAE